MILASFTETALRVLDWATRVTGVPDELPAHQRLGKRGEEAAYFYLRRRGYVMVARNFRSPHHRGEIDLIGWEGGALCFIEVKTRTSRELKPAEADVDREKRRDLMQVARDYMRLGGYGSLSGNDVSLDPASSSASCNWRMDVVSVYYDPKLRSAQFELFQNVSSLS